MHRTGKKEKKKKKKEKRKKKKKKCRLTVSLYIGFMALAVQCQRSLVSRRAWSVACQPQATHRSRGGDLRAMYAMQVQAVVIIETS